MYQNKLAKLRRCVSQVHIKKSFEKLSHSAAEQIKCSRWEESILMFSWKCCSTYFYPETYWHIDILTVDIFFSFLFDMAAFCQQQCIQINVSLHLQPYILKAKTLQSLLFSHKISAEKVRKFQHEHFATKVCKLIKSLKLIFAVECSFKYLHICTFAVFYLVEICSSARLQKKANSFTNNQKRSAKETSYKEWKLCKYFF